MDLMEAEHDPTEVLKAMCDLRKEQVIRENNGRSHKGGYLKDH